MANLTRKPLQQFCIQPYCRSPLHMGARCRARRHTSKGAGEGRDIVDGETTGREQQDAIA